MASSRNGTLYVGITSNLVRRVYEHKTNQKKSFTSRYNIHTLVYYEKYYDAESAISREKRIKEWHRQWKLRLIERHNSTWKDLSKGWYKTIT